MTTQEIHDAALAQGIAPQALAQVTAQVQAYFGDGTPTPAAVAQFLTALPVWDKLGMTQEAFLAMPGTWRMDRGRDFAPPPVSRRPTMRALTAAELAELERTGLTGAARIERARQMQQTPVPQP